MTRANEHHRDHRDRGGGTVFVLRLHAPSGQAGIFALRRALKFRRALLRPSLSRCRRTA